MPIKPPVPRYAKHPFEVSTMVGFILSSLSLMVFGPTSSATSSELGTPTLAWMAVAITMGALAVIAAGYWKDVIVAAFVEMGGLFGVFGPTTIYVATLASNVENWLSGMAAAALFAQILACVWRFGQVVEWVIWVCGKHPPDVWDRITLREDLNQQILDEDESKRKDSEGES